MHIRSGPRDPPESRALAEHVRQNENVQADYYESLLGETAASRAATREDNPALSKNPFVPQFNQT